ncbi:hypothetical protein ABN028_30435 [Actinopolymorpha sp. B17G11]|uniref:hypothetical protein n=1 Tax=unclassified Actinopolymorpha TaxID=2627063 RepID=UPI0032D8BC09
MGVCAGLDPLTGKDSYLTESTKDQGEAEKIRTRLLAQVDKQRQAATKATLGYVLDSWIQVHDIEETTPTTTAGTSSESSDRAWATYRSGRSAHAPL